MKKLFLVVVSVALFGCGAFAQTNYPAYFTDHAVGVSPFGNIVGYIPIQYGQVRVCNAGATGTPCTPLASITDIYGNPLTVQGGRNGQITTSVTGLFNFGCTGGSYEIQVFAGSSNTPSEQYNTTCPVSSINFNNLPPLGPLSAQSYDCEQIATRFPGTDIGAQINNAFAACGGASVSPLVRVPGGCVGGVNSGNCNFATQIVIPTGGTLIGDGWNSTVLKWTPSSGVALMISGTESVSVSGLTIHTTAIGNTSTCVDVTATNAANANRTYLQMQCGIEGDSNGATLVGFNKNFVLTGNDNFVAAVTWLNNCSSRNWQAVGISIDHAVGTNITAMDNYSIKNNPYGGYGLIMDTGASGLNITNMEMGYSGAIIRNTMPTTGTYGLPPNYLFASQLIADGCAGNCITFDSTLNTPSGVSNSRIGYSYHCVDCWFAGSKTGNGVEVDGGSAIVLENPRVRSNYLNGVHLNYTTNPSCTTEGLACGEAITITDADMEDNNAGSDASGTTADLYVEAGVSYWAVLGGNFWGTGLGDCCSGTDYAIYIASGSSDFFSVIGTAAKNQHTGTVSNNASGQHINLFGICNYDNVSCPVFMSRMSVEDQYFYMDILGGNPELVFASNDSLYYDRSINQFNFVVSSTTVASLNANGFNTSVGATFSGTGVQANKLTLTTAAPTVAAGQVGFGGTVAAASNCNSITGGGTTAATGCLVVNVAGTTRYVPYY